MLIALLKLRLWLFYPAYFLTIGFAVVKGAAPERAVAATFLSSFIVHRVLHGFNEVGSAMASVHPLHFTLDLLMAIALILIALFANRIYTLWIAGFQIVALQAHIAHAMTDAIAPLAYAIMNIAPIYLQLAALALGTWMHTRRVRRYGSYRSWRHSFFRWPGKMRVG